MTHAEGAHHLVVWLDHQLARLYILTRETSRCTLVRSKDAGRGHIHHHAGTPGAGHAPIDQKFLEEISAAIGPAREILIIGPSTAKNALKSFLTRRKPAQAVNVLGVATVDHGSDEQIVAFARQFFSRADRLNPPANWT